MPVNVSDSDSGVLWWGAEDDLRDSTGWGKELFNNLAALHKNKVNFVSPLSSSVQGSRQSQQGLKVLVVALSYCYFNIIELSTVYRFTYILGVLTQTLRSLI